MDATVHAVSGDRREAAIAGRRVGNIEPVRLLWVVGYPFAVFAGLHLARPGLVATVLVLAVLAEMLVASVRGRPRRGLAGVVECAAITVVMMGVAFLDEARLLLFVPAATNVAFLASFASSLIRGPSTAELFARLRYPDLPAEAVVYCRRVTALWCGFFALNAAVIAGQALRASLEWWTVYTGVLAYLLAGALLLAERLYRRRRFPAADARSRTRAVASK